MRGDFSLVHARTLFADYYLAPIAVEGPLMTIDVLWQAQHRPGLASGDRPTPATRLILPPTVAAHTESAASHERTDVAAPAPAPSANDRQDASPEVAVAPGPDATRLRPQSLRRCASDVPFLAVASFD